MKWTWVAVGLFLLADCQANNFDEHAEDPGDMVHLTIQKIQKKKTSTTYDISFQAEDDQFPKEMKKCMLEISIVNKGPTTPVEGFRTQECTCPNKICEINFDSFITASHQNTVTFMLSGLTNKSLPIIEGEALWTSFPDFPTDFMGQQVKDEENKYILRLKGNCQDMPELTPFPGGQKVISDKLTITYFIDISSKLTTIAACSKSGVSLLCDADVNVDNPKDIPKTLTLKSALLSYEYNTTGTVVEITVTPGSSADCIDVINTHSNILYPSTDLSAEMPIETLTPGMDIPMKIIGLTKADNTMVEYGDFSIKDIDVTGYPVSDTSFEVRWIFQNGVTQYEITRTKVNTGDTGFTEVTVTCDQPESTYCFGFFTGVKTMSDYKVTVPVTEDGIIKVQSASIHVGNSEPDLNIQHVQLQGYGNELKATVCFNHTNNNAEEAFSHYDVVLIDRNGQFQKDKLITMKAARGDHFCSRPFSVKDQDFEVTEEAKVIVIKRAQDGLSVLASGEAPLL